MSEVNFYHLQQSTLEQVLPKLLEHVGRANLRAVVLCDTQERIEVLNALLWTYDPGSFLAHGSSKEGSPENQPVYLAVEDGNPNGAEVLILLDGREVHGLSEYQRVLDIFDGSDEAALVAARSRWSGYKGAGHTVVYWQQKASGGWEQSG